MFLAILLGLGAGCLHVLSGPDHWVAVAPLALRRSVTAWKVGIRWGVGHATGVLLVGLISLLFRNVLIPNQVSSISERLVGVMLIAVGLWTLSKALRVTDRPHSHENGVHAHPHSHFPSPFHPHAAMGIGALHGLAGGSHFLGVLPALAFTRWVDGVGYLSGFGLGSVGAMVAFSSAMGFLAGRFVEGSERLLQALSGFCGVAAILLGTYWILS